MSAPIKNPLLHQKLVSTRFLLVLSLTLLVIFVILRPSKSEFFNEHYLSEPDGLSIAYLELLLDAQPDNDKIRWGLAHQLRLTGRYEEALEVLSPLLPKQGSSFSSRIFEIYFELLWAIAESSRPQERERLQKKIVKLYGTLVEQDWPIVKIRRLLDIYGSRLEVDDVIPVYENFRWIVFLRMDWSEENEPDRKRLKYEYKHILAKLDRLYLAKARLEEAIEVNKELLALVTNESERIEVSRQLAQRYLWSGNPSSALEYIVPLVKEETRDLDLLRLGINIARQSNELEIARGWLQQLLKVDPDSKEDWLALFETTVGTGEHLGALALVSKLEELDLYSIEIQRQVAYLYQWTDQPRLAYEQWKRVMEQTGNQLDERNTWMLAVALHDHEAVDRLLSDIKSRRLLDGIEMRAYVDNLLLIGDSRSAAVALQEAIVRFPRIRSFYEKGYRVLADDFMFADAAKVLEKMKRNFELETGEVITLANLYWIVRDTKSALKAIQDFFATDPEYTKDYWVLRTQLALLEYDNEDALNSWLQVSRYPLTEIEYEIFYQVLGVSYGLNNYVVSAQLAKSGYDLFGEPALLMDALEFNIYLGNFDQVSILIDIVRSEAPSLLTTANYLKVLATYSEHYGDVVQAREYWKQALALESDNEEYVIPWLWFLVNNYRFFSEELRDNLNYYASLNAYSDSWYDVFAYGYSVLEEHEVALSWFLEGLETRRDNWSWMMGLAAACFETGRYEIAYQIRGTIYQQMTQAYGQSGVLAIDSETLRINPHLRSLDFDDPLRPQSLTVDQFIMLLSLQNEFSGPKGGWELLRKQIGTLQKMPGFWESQLPQQVYANTASQRAYHWADHLADLYKRRGVKLSESERLAAALRRKDLPEVQSVLNEPFGLAVTERMQGYAALGLTRHAQALGFNSLRTRRTFSDEDIRRLNTGYGKNNRPDWAFFNSRSGGTGSFVSTQHLRKRIVNDHFKLDLVALREQIDLVLVDRFVPIAPSRVNKLAKVTLTRKVSPESEITTRVGINQSKNYRVGQAALSYAYTGSSPLTYQLRGVLNVETVESTTVRAVAQRSGIEFNGRYAIDGRFSVATQINKDYFELFSGASLGEKLRLAMRAEYQLLKSRPLFSVYGQFYLTDYSWRDDAEMQIQEEYDLDGIRGFQSRLLPFDNTVASVGFELAKGSRLTSLQTVASDQWSLTGELGFDSDAKKFAWSVRTHNRWQFSPHLEIGISAGWQRHPIESEANWDSALSIVYR